MRLRGSNRLRPEVDEWRLFDRKRSLRISDGLRRLGSLLLLDQRL